MNKVFLIGHVGKDPESKTFGSGNTVASFSLATNKRFKVKDGEKKQETTWHNCQAWNKTADLIMTYIKKGSHIFVGGEISISNYETDQGEKRSMHRVTVHEIQFLDRRDESTSKNETKTNNQKESNKMPNVDKVETSANYTADDIPF